MIYYRRIPCSKKYMAVLSAFILAGCLYAECGGSRHRRTGNCLREDVQITDGGGSRAETIFKKSGHRKDYGKTDWAAVMYFLTTPPGMDMYPDRAPYPYDSLHLYQIRKSDIRGHLFRFRLCCERNGRSLLPWETGKGCPVFGSAHSMKMRHGRTPSSA